MPSPREVILTLLLLLMEILAGFALVVGSSLLDATTLQYGMFWLFLLSGAAGLAVGYAVAITHPRQPIDRVALLIGGVVASLVPARLVSHGWLATLAAAGLLAVAYWRGTALTQDPPDYGEVQARFGLGFGVLFTGLVWTVARGGIDRPALWHMLAIVGITYTITAMTALVLARVEHTRERGAGPAIVLAVGLQLGVLALLSLITLEIFAHDLATALFNLTRPFWDAIGPVWTSALALLFAPLGWLIDLLRAHAHNHVLHITPVDFNPHGNAHKRLHAKPTHSIVPTILGFTFLALLAAGIASVIWLTVPRLRRYRPRRGYTDERRTALSPAAIWRGFLRWLRGLGKRGGAAAGSVASATRHRLFGPVYPEDPVRRIYAQVLHRARTLGVERPAGITPVEFQRRLAHAWPDAAPDLASVTSAYVIRRYGEAPLPAEEIASLRESWERLREVMRRRAPEPEVAVPPGSAVPARSRPGTMRDVQGLAQALRSFLLELSGAVLAVIVLLGFIIAAVAVAIFLSGK